jgi:hypothetical protein
LSYYNTGVSMVANGNILPATFLMQDPANDLYAIQATYEAVVIGICQSGSDVAPMAGVSPNYAAVAGEIVMIYPPCSMAPLKAGPLGWTPGPIKSDANGYGVNAFPGEITGAWSYETAGPGEQRPVVVLPPNLQSRGATKTVAVDTQLIPGNATGTIFVTTTGRTITLPPVSNVGLAVRVISAVAGSGTIVAINAADVASAKMIGNGFTPAAGKGAIDTAGTALVGDSISVQSNGTDWYILTPVGGIWARQP